MSSTGPEAAGAWPNDYLAGSQVETFGDAVARLQTIEPNYPQPSDLRPSELGADGLAQIVDAFTNIDGLRAARRDGTGDFAVLEYELPGIGTLRRVGDRDHSEKICYRLTTPDHKQMAVLVAEYDSSLGMQVPRDSRIAITSQSPETRLHEYADLRQYFIAPVGSHAVKLQEWGGPNLDQSRSPLPLGLAYLTTFLAERRLRATPGLDLRFEDHTWRELRHRRNMVLKPGSLLPLVIDVKFVQRTNDYQEE